MPIAENDRIERALLAALADHRGETLSKKDRVDLDWYRKKLAAELVDTSLESIPKKLYLKLSGRATRVINDQATLYGLPMGGPTVDLFALIRGFHDLLAKHSRTFVDSGDDDDLKRAKLKGEIEVLERRAKILDGEINQQRSRYIDRGELRRRLEWLVGRIADLGERLGKMGGPDVQRALNEFLEELASEVEGGNLAVDDEGAE